MRPNPSTEELQSANRRAQNETREALAAAGLSYADAMDIVEDVDARDGVRSAWLSDDKIAVWYDDADEPEYVDITDEVVCPECGSDDVATDGVCPDPTRPMNTYAFGCRSCRNLWGDD